MHTRFAPSPTGLLHIGGVRTALFAWIMARQNQGIFSLRIEDTDSSRNSQESIQAIYDGMKWLGLDWDGEVVMQSKNIARHVEVAQTLLKKGLAYRCALTPEDIEAQREEARKNKKPLIIKSPWRDTPAPEEAQCTIRLKVPHEGKIVFDDLVRGHSSKSRCDLDDMILLRSDGTPTYMLAVVVDDHDVGVDTIIRGDDHHSNTFRQIALYEAMEWKVPSYGHIPLVLDEGGKKMSKRDGLSGLETYIAQGILPEAMRSMLLRIGWDSTQVQETCPTNEIIEKKLFTPNGLQKSAGRFSLKKLKSLSKYWMTHLDSQIIMQRVLERYQPTNMKGFTYAFPSCVERSTTLCEIIDQLLYLNGVSTSPEDLHALDITKEVLEELEEKISQIDTLTPQTLHAITHDDDGKMIPRISMGIRMALTHNKRGLPADIIILSLGKEESLTRIRNLIASKA